MIAYTTKYALTRGILTAHGYEDGRGYLDCVIGLRRVLLKPSEYHETLEKAIERAEEMRKEEIAELKDRIDQLEKMNFTGEEK